MGDEQYEYIIYTKKEKNYYVIYSITEQKNVEYISKIAGFNISKIIESYGSKAKLDTTDYIKKG